MMIRIALATASLAMLTACSSAPKAPPPISELAYPHGTYQHKVKVELVSSARKMDVRGVVESRADELKVVGISTFGTTVFRVDENYRTGELNKEFYVDALKRNEERFMYFYALLKEMLNTPKGQTEFEKQGAKFKFSNPDKNQIYRTVAIQHPEVNLNIEVTGYEF